MNNGTRPVKPDHRDYSFHRTFGSVGSLDLPAEYNCDAGFGMPNQNTDGFPNGCTGYTQTEICQDEDALRYNPAFTYMMTRMMEGTYPQPVGCDVRDSLKSTITYGVQAPTETTGSQAFVHHRGQYYNIEQVDGMDWFDSIRSALWVNRLERRSASVATIWYPDWENDMSTSGMLPMPENINIPANDASWHNYKICGWTSIGGYQYLITKSWQGDTYGNKGWAYFSREVIDAVLSVSQTAAFTVALARDVPIQTVELGIIGTIISYFQLWFNLK